MAAYYNEIDADAAAVLRELVARDVIAPGDVDERSIKDVTPDDLRSYTQCHFFAGGGLWSVAARLAGWPDDRALWTGSCPCQPFSAAGKGLGTDDPRHLWPDFHRLLRAGRPPVVMGEQVAGAAGYAWFDGVRADLEGEGYSGRAVDIPACAVDAPHQRNRLFWIAMDDRRSSRRPVGSIAEVEPRNLWSKGPPASAADARTDGCSARLQPDADSAPTWRDCRSLPRSEGEGASSGQEHRDRRDGPGHAPDGLLADADRGGRDGWQEDTERHEEQRAAVERPYARNGSWWADAEWIVSPLDGKARRAKPGIPFLVDGLPGRVGLWRVGGNAISPILAAEVIAAFLDAEAATR